MTDTTHDAYGDLGSKPTGGGCVVIGSTGSTGSVRVVLQDGMGRQVASGDFSGGSYRFDGLDEGNYQVEIGGAVVGSTSVSGASPVGTVNS